MKRVFKIFVCSFILLFALNLCACGSEETDSGALVLPETPVADAVEAVTMTEDEHAEMLTAYKLALQDFAFKHIRPDGTTFEISDGFGYMEENAFAIYDVDSDGAEELLIQYSTDAMSGMFERVYRYENGAITEQLLTFPGCTYYLNNLVLCPWSHNQTAGPEDFWPYSVAVYRADSDSYEFTASVEGWDKSVSETRFADGSTFPTEKDDGSGIVYIVSVDNETGIFNPTEFALWEKLTFGDAVPHTIPWQDMTEENINNLAA